VTIRKKLILAFGITAAALAVIAGVLYWGNRRVYELQRWSAHSAATYERYLGLQSEVGRYLKETGDLISFDEEHEDDGELRAARAAIAGHLAALAELRENAADFEEEEDAAVEDDLYTGVRAGVLEFQTSLDGFLALARSGAVEKAKEAIEEEGDGLFDEKLIPLIEKAVLQERGEAEEARAEVESLAALLSSLAIGLSVAAAAIVCAALWLVGRSLNRGLAGLLAGTARLSAGELSQEVPVEGKDELAEIARAFNEMTRELRASRGALEDKIRDRTRALEESLTELKESQAQLLQAGKMAAVGTLIAGLAHEFNNPIGVILGFTQTLLQGAPEGDPLHEPLSAIERQAQRCSSLVRALLDFSRKKASDRERVSAPVLMGKLIALSEGTARRRSVKLSAAPAGPLPELEIAVTEIESALLNLINNALDATPAGGRVELSAHAARRGGRDGVELRVADTGGGMAADVVARIFDPFFTTKPAGQGTGLGLSLARKFVELHGGEIAVESEVGAGTTMRVWLPAAGGVSQTRAA
jgi:signal transduction histidine kinase